MTLPVALVKEQPHGMFSHLPYLEAVTANVLAAQEYYHKVQELDLSVLNDVDKEFRKRNKDQRKEVTSVLEMYNRLVKYSDIAALIAMSQPEYKLIEYSEFKRNHNLVNESILVRGIAAGPYIDIIKEKGYDYYFVETGYFGNYKCEGNANARKYWHRIVKNAMQHTTVLDVPDDRWTHLESYDSRLKNRHWKKEGRNILLVAPSEKPCEYYGINKDEWVCSTVETIKQYTDRPIIIREKGDRTERTSTNIIYDAFDQDIFSVVTYNSIAAAEAVAYGIPAFALAPTAAEPVCSNDLTKIETPYYPDREFVYKWLCSLAYDQYHLDELLNGTAWRLVQENEQRSTISY